MEFLDWLPFPLYLQGSEDGNGPYHNVHSYFDLKENKLCQKTIFFLHTNVSTHCKKYGPLQRVLKFIT